MSTIYTGTVEERVKQCIAEQLGFSAALIRNDENLYSDLGADSLDAVELVMAIEDEFEIEVTDEQAEAVRTVQDAIDLVRSKVQP